MIAFLLGCMLAVGQYEEVVSVRYVLFNVNVTNSKGKPVTDLNREDFKLWIDLKPYSFEHFSHDFSSPVSTLFLLDNSGSMSIGKRPELAEKIIRRFLLFWRQGDEFALATFQNRELKLVVPFPGSRLTLFSELISREPYGQTALYDALSVAGDLLKAGGNKRRQIVLITDSHDNYSEMNPDAAVNIVRNLEVPVHVLCLPLTPHEPLEIQFLNTLAEETGGTLHVIKMNEWVEKSVSIIINLVHHQYLIGFAPDPSQEDRYRRVQIDVKGKYDVHTRKGFVGSPPYTN